MGGSFLKRRGEQVAPGMVREFAEHATGGLEYDLQEIAELYDRLGRFGIESIEPIAAELMRATDPLDFFKATRVINSARAYEMHRAGTPQEDIDHDAIGKAVIDDYLDVLCPAKPL